MKIYGEEDGESILLWSGPGTTLCGADLHGAKLGGANLQGMDLRGANLADAVLTGANFTGAQLDGADLSRAEAGGANFSTASCRGANFRAVRMPGAAFAGADLTNADLRCVDERYIDWKAARSLVGANRNYPKEPDYTPNAKPAQPPEHAQSDLAPVNGPPGDIEDAGVARMKADFARGFRRALR